MIQFVALLMFVASGYAFLRIVRNHGFRLPPSERSPLDPNVGLRHFIGAISIWVFAQIITASLLKKLALQDILNLNFRQWFCFVDTFSNLIIAALLFALIRHKKLHILGKKSLFKNGFLKGALYGLALQLPLMLIMTGLQYTVDLFGPFARGDELCENLLDDCLQFPWLYVMTFFSFTILCPIVEELIFRGFLQNWLVRYLGATYGIVTTSLLFAAAHFSTQQGASNVELLSAIFILSCLFGMLYQKERTIGASMGMHITNNMIALLLRSVL